MMMKWLIRLAFPALGLLMVLIFFGINDPETVANPKNVEVNTQIPTFEGLVPSPIKTNGPEIVFKWRDSDGSWHYADRPPENGPWNALAIEPSGGEPLPSTTVAEQEDDWQAPYRAPFSLGPNSHSNGS